MDIAGEASGIGAHEGRASKPRGGRIVVGVDGSSGSRKALVWALRQAALRHAAVSVVSVVSSQAVYWSDAYLLDSRLDMIRTETEAQARAMVEEALTEPDVTRVPGAMELSIDVVAATGPAATYLLQQAESADLLVVGTRGRGALRSGLLGSVALACVTHAPCAVVVVHSQAFSPGHEPKVVVGVDLAAGSSTVLEAGVAEASRLGAEVEVVAAFETGDYWGSIYAIAFPQLEDIEEVAMRRLDLTVGQLRMATPSDSVGTLPTIRTQVRPGRAGDVLVRRSQDADLLVVGSRARGGLRGLILGSTALHCVMHAKCPVLVIPLRHDEEAPAARSEATAQA